MHQLQRRPHTALPSTFLALLLTTLAMSTSTPTSAAKTVLIFLAFLAATLTAAHYIIVSPAEPNTGEESEDFDFKDVIRRRRERGVLNDGRFGEVFGWEDERALRGEDERALRGEERRKEERKEERRKRGERRKEVRAALRREVWPTRGELLGASREGREDVVEGEEDEDKEV